MPIISSYNVFEEIVLLLLIAAVAGVLALRLRQPPIVGFIIAGILVGPSVLNLIRSVDQVHILAEMGLALLLFVVGLKLDVGIIRSMGPVSLNIGLAQVVFTAIGGYILSYSLGMNKMTSLYVALALTFSSTVIIVKVLSDRRETDSLHGRIAIGLLIVQDILVVLVMVFLSAFSGGKQHEPVYRALLIAVKGAGLIAGTWSFSVLVLPRLLSTVARSSEMLALFGIVWALALAAAGELLGFSKEIGAFVAGVSLASTPYREAMSLKLSNVRDFLLLFFFVELGSRLDLGAVGSKLWMSIPLVLYVLAGKPVIMMAITGVMGYRKRTSVLAGLTVGQVSEFSLILVAMGTKFGHLGNDTVGLVTLVALVTIGLSTYMIEYSHRIYYRLSPYIGILERGKPCREDACEVVSDGSEPADTLILGLGSYGTGIAEQLESWGRRVLGVDFDPQAIRRWSERGMRAVFGDATDMELPRALDLSHIKWVISSIRGREVNSSLVKGLRQAGYKGLIAVAGYDRADETSLIAEGADLVFNPFADAAVQAADLVVATEEQIARRAMDKQIESMSDHYIICGYGRMGQQIVKDLTRHNVPCVVVEWNPEQLPKLREQNIPHVEGKASEDPVLVKAGIKRAKGLIAVAPSDEENVFIVLTARVLNPNLFIVARSILKENEDKLRYAGADIVMSPYILGGRRMAAAVIRPEVMDFLDLVVDGDRTEVEIAKITVDPKSGCVGKTLREVNLWETSGVTLLAIRRQGEELRLNPNPDLSILGGDELIVMGTSSQIAAARDKLSSASC